MRFSFTGSVNPLNNKNGLSCLVYYKLKSATAWTQAYKMAITSYNLSATNQLLEQAVSIATKGVILDFMADGTGIGIGKVAETSGYIDCGWPLKLSTALAVAYGGTGATSAAGAIANLGGVKKTGDTMTGNLNISGYLYPSMLLLPTYLDFEFSVPVTGAITFKIMFEEGVLPKVWPEARTRKTRKAKAEEAPAPESITTGLQAALEQAEAEGQPVAEIAEAVAQGAEITAELNGQELTITAHEPETMEVNRRTPQGAGRGR